MMHHLTGQDKFPQFNDALSDVDSGVLDSNLKHARYLHQQGQIKAAQKLYQQILNSNPNHAEANHLLGMSWVHVEDFDEAFTFLAKAAHLEPRNLNYINNFGAITLHLGDYAEAIKVLEYVLSKDATHSDAHCNLSIAHIALGQFQEAIYAAKQALQYQPTMLRAQMTLLQAIAFEYPAQGWESLLDKLDYPYLPQASNEKTLLQACSAWINGSVDKSQAYLKQFIHADISHEQYSAKEKQTYKRQRSEYDDLQLLVTRARPKVDPNAIPMYVVGDVQALHYHHMPLQVNETKYVVHAVYVRGVKSNHLVAPKNNAYLESIQLRLSELIDESMLIFQVGPLEPLFSKYIKQHPQLNLDPNVKIHEMTSSYIHSIQALIQQRQFKVYIAGPPAIQSQFKKYDSQHSDNPWGLYQEFTENLKNLCIQAGFHYLDLFELTQHNPSLIIFQQYLRSSTLQIAFNELAYGRNSDYSGPRWVL